ILGVQDDEVHALGLIVIDAGDRAVDLLGDLRHLLAGPFGALMEMDVEVLGGDGLPLQTRVRGGTGPGVQYGNSQQPQDRGSAQNMSQLHVVLSVGCYCRGGSDAAGTATCVILYRVLGVESMGALGALNAVPAVGRDGLPGASNMET